LNDEIHQSLHDALAYLADEPDIHSLQQDTTTPLHDYEQLFPLLEQKLWSNEPDNHLLLLCQSLYREYERQLANNSNDTRYRFVVVIPVADRPIHLKTCLQSIYDLCETFCYGGRTNRYDKVCVVIADDSAVETNILRHRELADAFNARGLDVDYFGQQQQREMLHALSGDEPDELLPATGPVTDSFSHKGASRMRNITYLYLARDYQRNDTLFYFIDSDQEFRLNHPARPGQAVSGLNYFYHLDRLFRENDIKMLTGKVVGDPPVSPAVMAANFLTDLLHFFTSLASHTPAEACRFHQDNTVSNNDASYHDMADLFGYKRQQAAHAYTCPLQQPHDHVACLRHLVDQLEHFFDGEHPTRCMYFDYAQGFDALAPARTVYTGNYVFTSDMLAWFIPFAQLQLRMAGPVLGRFVRQSIGHKFVSANIPLLHRRTVTALGQSEFRPGIQRKQAAVDLAQEFERQFFGDIMLFVIDELTAHGYPASPVAEKTVVDTLTATEDRLLQRYRQQHASIRTHLDNLTVLFNDQQYWWHQLPELADARTRVQYFLSNMQRNFGETALAYQRINDKHIREQYRQHMCDAIIAFPDNFTAWQRCLQKLSTSR